MVSGKSSSRAGASRAGAPRAGAPRSRVLRTQVAEAMLHLRHIQSAVVVAVAALRRQNCELDEDIASVLQRSVADRIQDQIDRLEITVRAMSTLERRGKQPS